MNKIFPEIKYWQGNKTSSGLDMSLRILLLKLVDSYIKALKTNHEIWCTFIMFLQVYLNIYCYKILVAIAELLLFLLFLVNNNMANMLKSKIQWNNSVNIRKQVRMCFHSITLYLRNYLLVHIVLPMCMNLIQKIKIYIQ